MSPSPIHGPAQTAGGWGEPKRRDKGVQTSQIVWASYRRVDDNKNNCMGQENFVIRNSSVSRISI